MHMLTFLSLPNIGIPSSFCLKLRTPMRDQEFTHWCGWHCWFHLESPAPVRWSLSTDWVSSIPFFFSRRCITWYLMLLLKLRPSRHRIPKSRVRNMSGYNAGEWKIFWAILSNLLMEWNFLGNFMESQAKEEGEVLLFVLVVELTPAQPGGRWQPMLHTEANAKPTPLNNSNLAERINKTWTRNSGFSTLSILFLSLVFDFFDWHLCHFWQSLLCQIVFIKKLIYVWQCK